MVRSLCVTTAILLIGTGASAQELEARAYRPAPIGTTIVIAGFGGSKGGIVFDQAVDVADVEADLKILVSGVGYTFALAGRQARILAVFPMAWGTIAGDVGGQPQAQDLAGLVDPRIKFTIGLLGAPALTPAEFARAPRRTVVGTSVTVMPPIGQYSSTQLVNLGYNRWAFKPEIGASRTIDRWTLETYAGVWLYTENTSYFPGNLVKEQDAILSLQSHVSYALPRRLWVAFIGTWFAGGETRTNRAVNPDQQRNTRLGATVSIPLTAWQSVKVVWSTGATTRRGSDFDSFTVTWQLVRF
jgi:hypothetical protein